MQGLRIVRIAAYCDVLKLLRVRPASAADIAEAFGVKDSRAREWLQELCVQGLADIVGEESAKAGRGRRSVLYTLAQAWRGGQKAL